MWARTATLVRRRPSSASGSWNRSSSWKTVGAQRPMDGSIFKSYKPRHQDHASRRCVSHFQGENGQFGSSSSGRFCVRLDGSNQFLATVSLDDKVDDSAGTEATAHPQYATPIATESAIRRQQRTRAALALYIALAKEASNGNPRHGARNFSSSTKHAGPKAGNDASVPEEPFSDDDSRTDPDFAEYLTTDDPHTDPTTTTPTADGTTGSARRTVHVSQPPDFPLYKENHQALTNESALYEQTYKKIRRRQETQVLQGRNKAAANVRRALVGNLVICVAKLGAWISSGSSSMLSEFIHSVVDVGNQSLLLLGLRDSGNVADRKHPYGYGKSVYFWALVSALGTFFLGAGISATHAVGELMEPSLSEITWHVWAVLGVSFAVDGWVFTKTVRDIRDSMPEGKTTTFMAHLWTVRDPALLAVLLEDGAACLGIVMAIAGIAATHATGMPVFDGLAGLGISGLLASMGVVLVRVNHRFLLGRAVDSDITEGIQEILMNRRSIDNVHSVQSQWTGPDTFSYKAEVDFDGTFLAAKLMPRYQQEFLEARDTLDQDLRVLLSWYAEDVMRTVEREVRHIEAEIRKEYPGAEFIELEPMSKEMDRFAIDDGMEAQLRRIEIEALNRYLKSLYPKNATKSGGENMSDEGSNNPDEGKPKQ